MGSIVGALRQVKAKLAERLTEGEIGEVARRLGCRWRDRVLTPAVTLQLFLLQILHGNVCCAHTPRLGGKKASGSAYCQARQRLPLVLMQTLLRRLVEVFDKSTTDDDDKSKVVGGEKSNEAAEEYDETVGRWRGLRTFLIDGSSCSMPDTPELQKEFDQPSGQKKGCGFPVAHLLALFDAGTGLLIDVLASSWRIHDLTRVAELHGYLLAGDLLVADRGFCSFGHLALLLQRQVHAVLRIHQRIIVDFTPKRPHATSKSSRGKPRSTWLAALGGEDQVVRWRRPIKPARWMTAEEHAALPEHLVVRELRYRVAQAGFRTRAVTLVTTLLDPEQYPAEALAELYGARWQVETNLRHLKETMGMKVLHCQSVAGVRKELLAFALVYNLVRAVMLKAARHAGVDPDRISFVDALRWLCNPWDQDRLTPLTINPLRPNRFEPRVRKRRPPQYPLMTEPRSKLHKTLRDQSLGA